MIAVDANILVYAHRRDSPFHDAADRCLAEIAERPTPWALPWPCIHEFLAVVTSPRIFKPPTPVDIALEQVEAWLQSPSVVLLSETETHWATLKTALAAGRIAGPRVHDARIAALCRQHGVSELWTADRDFSRFASLKTRNPLFS